MLHRTTNHNLKPTAWSKALRSALCSSWSNLFLAAWLVNTVIERVWRLADVYVRSHWQTAAAARPPWPVHLLIHGFPEGSWQYPLGHWLSWIIPGALPWLALGLTVAGALGLLLQPLPLRISTERE